MDGARARAWETALILIAIVPAGLVAAFPHWNPVTGQVREYPVHMDEWVHWGIAASMQGTGDIAGGDPFTGGGDGEVALATYLHERGFHAYLATLQATTGVDWPTLLAALPIAVAMLSALAVYALARRWDAGPFSALWVAAVPTSLRFLGPGFVVPIAWTLPMIALAVHVLLGARDFRSYVAVGILCAGAWPIHAMGALVLLVLCALAALASAKHPSRAAALVGVAALPALIAYPYYASAGAETTATLPPTLETIRIAGPLLFVAAAIGLAVLASRPGHGRAAVMLGGLLALGLGVIAYRAETGNDPYRLYDRTTTLLAFVAAIPAGVASAMLVRGASRLVRAPAVVPAAIALLLLVQGGAVAASAREQMDQDFYEVVSADRYAEYERVAPLLHPQDVALVHGQTMPFTMATGVPTVYVFLPTAAPPPVEVSAFFEGGGKDTLFLLRWGIDVVVSDAHIDNPYLAPLSDHVYVVRADLARPEVAQV